MRKFTFRLLPGIALAALFLCSGLSLMAQQRMENNPDVIKMPLMEIEKVATLNFKELKDDWDPYIKTVRKIHQPGVDVTKDEFRRLKAEANELKRQTQQGSGVMQKTAGVNPPTLGVNFFGNSYNFADPADNTVAVSAGGMIVSGSNTRIHIYDDQGSQQAAGTLTSYISGMGLSSFTFDPKFTYDPVADRFIICFLSGANSGNSRVVVGFSATNDPTGNWHMYAINGNPNSMGVWTDFPQIGISTDELFITGNLFTNGGSAQGSAIWQMELADGYAGAGSVTTQEYVTNFFSLHPVEGGSTSYGPHFYIIQSDQGSSNQVSLHRITNTIANNGVLEPPLTFQMNMTYSMPPDADQASSSSPLRTNDTRIQSSYIENDRIIFTLNTGFAGTPAVFVGTGEISPFLLSFSNFTGQIVTFDNHHLAYGSVAYGGSQASDGTNSTLVAFNYCGPTLLPGMGCAWIDSSGISPMLTVRTGVGPINSADDRWGDYADCQERGSNGECWMVGTFGNSSQNQRTYVAQIFPPQPVAIDPVHVQKTEMDIYPNPTTDRVVFEFPVEVEGVYKVIIRDMEGRTVKMVVEDYLRLGEGRIAFNTTALASGTYFVSVENDERKLFTEKLSVQH